MATYTNSSLISYTKISPHTNPRVNSTYNPSGKITKITIHHMAGNLSVETCGNVFQSAEASSNYGIGSDGRIAMYAEESKRTWASASPSNDYVAVTIEVANSYYGDPWPVTDAAYNSLINLCVDICKRNGIAKLNYTGDASGNLTRHNMFMATTCPGPYLQSRFPQIAEEVNKRLGSGGVEPQPEPSGEIDIGDVVDFLGGEHYTSSTSTIPASSNVAAGPAKVTNINIGAIHPYHLVHTNAQSGVYGWVSANQVKGQESAPGSFEVGSIVNFAGGNVYYGSASSSPSSTGVRPGPAKITVKANGAPHPYHVVHTDNTSGVYGWVDASQIGAPSSSGGSTPAPSTSIKVGDKIRIKSGATDSNTGSKFASFVYNGIYDAIEVTSSKVVFGLGSAITGVTSINSVTKA